jgi:hypothetical protein
MLDASKSKGCILVVRLHAACMPVRPFTRWFGRKWRSACNRRAVTYSACGGLAASVPAGLHGVRDPPPYRRGRILERVGEDLVCDA